MQGLAEVRDKKTRARVSNAKRLRITRRTSFKTSENLRKAFDCFEKRLTNSARMID
jgi:hypothetical protein